jgi:superfamily I DNA/RNA helicase
VNDEPAPVTAAASLVPLFAAVSADSLNSLQREVVERSYPGPAWVSGGPGTGKTTVALHRARHLAARLPAAGGCAVLLATFSKQLAADLRDRLLELAGPGVAERVDVVNIDALAWRVARAAEPGVPRHWLGESQAMDMWRSLLADTAGATPEAGAGQAGAAQAGWDPQFLQDEWTRVVLGYAVTSRLEYFRVRRAGRARRLNRSERASLWELFEEYSRRLAAANLWTFRQVTARAARLEMERAACEGARYMHVVVDEAQELSPTQWMLLRALAAPGPDDLFLVADPGRRVYGIPVSLASLGIDIAGRSTRLTVSYRPAPQRMLTMLAPGQRSSQAGRDVWVT